VDDEHTIRCHRVDRPALTCDRRRQRLPMRVPPPERSGRGDPCGDPTRGVSTTSETACLDEKKTPDHRCPPIGRSRRAQCDARHGLHPRPPACGIRQGVPPPAARLESAVQGQTPGAARHVERAPASSRSCAALRAQPGRSPLSRRRPRRVRVERQPHRRELVRVQHLPRQGLEGRSRRRHRDPVAPPRRHGLTPAVDQHPQRAMGDQSQLARP
jgi:hypothetical protein